MNPISTVCYLARTGNLDIAIRNRLTSHRHLMRRPAPRLGNWSVRRLNRLFAALPAMTNYLEIGLYGGKTFEHVELPVRVGVDPAPRFDLESLPPDVSVAVTTSDEFFATNEQGFDLVFLDGLHTYRQTYRDLVHAFAVCRRGAILVDDVVPADEVSAMPVQAESLAERARRGLPGRSWHGDVFRLAFCLAEHHPELAVRTIVGGGNPQMLLWKPDPDSTTAAVNDEALDRYSSLDYASAFAEGVPSIFCPVTEAGAIADAAEALAPRYALT